MPEISQGWQSGFFYFPTFEEGQRKYEMVVACSSAQPGGLARTMYQSLILCVIGNLKTIFAKSICLYLRIEIMTWLWLVAVVSRED